ncbi:MAG TPA: YifB family Mg chelatase-like AAA ATPase [Steroidobacteraceae bacterium]|nr:YifB family Mg chelatase-like AAA ATPase [Steroidobacteraceae bacterium]
MAVAELLSRAQLGLTAPLVHVEVHVGAGLPGTTIVGLPAPVVRESRERVRAALLNSGFDFPPGRITINLAPVELLKEGGRYDLPIALGLLMASDQLRVPAALLPVESLGELGLDGALKGVAGLLLAAVHAARSGHCLVVPEANLADARRAGCGRVVAAATLQAICAALQAGALSGEAATKGLPGATGANAAGHFAADTTEGGTLLDDIVGQAQPKRALLIAAAGGHSLLMTGPPGSGKSLLAACLPQLLPDLSPEEALEVASIASIAGPQDAGRAGSGGADAGRRPFRAPHHTASAHAIVGGGPSVRPGEITLAHRGVLFLDELPEYDRRVLESLREPLETGRICIARAAQRLELPAGFQLVAAMNPCPCGYLGDARQECRCGQRRVERYRARISGPLLDRIDLRIEVPRLDPAELLIPRAPCTAAQNAARRRVAAARQLQQARRGCLNAQLGVAQMQECCALGPTAERLLARSLEQMNLSARGVHRVLRVARTIADLDGAERLEPAHVAEAIQLRRMPAGGAQ